MEIFTYQDYLRYQEFIRKQKIQIANVLRENEETYHVGNKQVNHEHDKVFRSVLDDKREVAIFINQTLKLKEKITEEQIEKYNSSFVSLEFKNQECDVIYKMKKQNIFFLIEQQTKIDYTMPLRIAEYVSVIMKSAIDKKKLGQKGYKYPAVIPIVIYTGRKKWKAKNYIKDIQEELEGYEGLEFAKYNVVDINDYTEEELLKEESFLSKVMLIEKARHSNSLTDNLEKIVQEINAKKNVYTKDQKDLLITIIELVLKSKLDEEEREKLIKNLKEGKGKMLAVLEMLEEENKSFFRKGKREGKKEAKLEYARKMLEKGIDIETIIEITGVSKEKIEQ